MIPSKVDWIEINKFGDSNKIASNLVLVRGNTSTQLVLKKARKSSSFVDFLKFQNELRFYRYFSQADLKYLKVPQVYDFIPGKAIFMEYLEGGAISDFHIPEFVPAYIEFQHQNIPYNSVIDKLNQSFRGFDYKVGGVALLTVSRQESLNLALRIAKVYLRCCAEQPQLNRKYWQHGDLHRRNIIMGEDKNLYFIDFENCFFTRRWPLCEVFGECIQCEEGGIQFHPELFLMYWESLPIDSPLLKLDLALQLRFAMLRKAVHVILQSKFEFRKNYYRQFLNEKLVDKALHDWSHSVIAGLKGYLN